MGRHRNLVTINGEWYGRIGSDPGPLFDHLRGEERIRACDKAYAERYVAAYEAIIKEYPEASQGRRSMGEIIVTL
jgi:hypothetical protein